MHTTLEKWLYELEDEIHLIDSYEINVEANENMYAFGLNEQLLKDWGNKSLIEFIKGCSLLYQSKNKGSEKVFYCWLDEMAGQLRISAVSAKHQQLPFSCQLNICELETVVGSMVSLDGDLFGSHKSLYVWQTAI